MKTFFILIACAVIDLTLSKVNEDCIAFANKQDQDFYEGDFLEYSYAPCNDPEGIIEHENKGIKCIPLEGNKPLLKNQTCQAGEYKHYHWTIQDYDVINDNGGSAIEFALTPCQGHPELYIKPQILYAGIPMCQLFETKPGTEGIKTSTWPFPNNLTGTGEQGPDSALFELEKKAKQGTKVAYPGAFFSEQVWGHNGSVTSDDGRPQPHRISIPSISYGGFFLSVYCKTASEFEVGIAAQQKVAADKDRHASRDEDSLAMKVRRFGYEVDDNKMDATWGSLKDTSAELFLAKKGYKCDRQDVSCLSNFYVQNFGLSSFPTGVIIGAHHPETTNRTLSSDSTNTTGDFCFGVYKKKSCEDQCCKWSEEGDLDIADFLKYGPFNLRSNIEKFRGICRPSTTKQSLCVTTKKENHMSADNEACVSDEDRDNGGCDRRIQSTMEVTFYTGETGGNAQDSPDTWPLFQLNHVEMNDCVSQLDKVGHEYCWTADFDRSIEEYTGGPTPKPAGDAGYKWSRTCGLGSGDKTCDPNYQTVGKCFWDGTPDHSQPNQTTREQPWSKNGDDCIMWTPCGVAKNGMPVMIEHKRGEKSPPALIQREIPAEIERSGEMQKFDVPGSYYIYGHVNDMTRESLEATPQTPEEDKYNRFVLRGDETWLPFPAHTWVRVEVPVLNNVTYFFNVLRKVSHNSTVESYAGVSAITFFYHRTQMYSDTTIIIIAAVVVVALLFLLIPFIYTKRKIKEHLRKVYEKHKERGQGRAKEEEGEAEKGDNVVNYADDDDKDRVVGYTVQDIATSEKEDPSMQKKDSTEPSKGGIIDVE